MTARMGPIVALVIVNYFLGGVNSAQYFGKFLGKLSELHHGVSGEVYAVDGRTLYLKDFTYDGQGPAAYFYASTSRGANSAGFRLRDENGSPEVIRRYRKEGLTLTLPEGKTLNSIKIFYVWCEEFEVNFGDVKIPRSLDYPRPQKIDALKGVHGVSSDNIVIVDAQTLLIPNFSYDGEAPDAKFWVGSGSKPSPQGTRIPDENGSISPLRRYDRKTVVLTLPSDLTVFDLGHFGVWCEAFTVDFGHVVIPQNLNIPPSLKMLGVTPQSKLNCEVLYDDLAFEVRWAIAGDSIVLQLVAKLDEREYMSFGISGADSKSVMIGGDVVVAWVDKTTLKGFAEDYYLGDKSQCSGPTGSCPDNRLSDNTNNIRLLNAAMVNGYSIVTYQRPLRSSDEYDRPIYTNRSQAIIWGIGPLNQRNEVSFHSHYLKKDKLLDFGRSPKWNCPMPEGEQLPMKVLPSRIREPVTEAAPSTTTIASRSRNPNDQQRRRGGNRTRNQPQQTQVQEDSQRSASTNSRNRQSESRRQSASRSAPAKRVVATPAPVSKRNAWYIPPIQCDEPEDGVFYAQMGPTGGKRGYPAITGHVGWGISWYINGLLIPEINVVRGKTYNFVVEGGFDPEVPAKFHPFYITDDPVGGYEHKTPEEQKNIRIFAGALTAKDGSVKPTGTGRLCHWTPQGDHEADDFDSFGAYQRTLELKCDQGEPGVIEWTPDNDTPDTVYYQCFTHRYLGWKINVLDACDNTQAAGSEVSAVAVPAPKDLEGSPSLRVESRVKANSLITDHKGDIKDYQSTVSEKSPLIDPDQGITTHTQLPINEPFLIQPQQSFYNPPQILMSHGPLLAHTYNPYIIESPLYISSPTSISDKTNSLLTQIIRDELMTIMNATKTTTTTPSAIVVTPQFSGKLFQSKASEVRPMPIKKYITRPIQSQRVKKPRPTVYRVPSRPIPPKPKYVQVSPQQASTEKPNTGFHPDTLVVENGFLPMIKKQNLPTKSLELEYESEYGMLPHDLPAQKEAVFIRNSGVGKPLNIHTRTLPVNKIVKIMSELKDEDSVPAAAERVESYYLPPLGAPLRPTLAPSQRSNIDAEPPIFDDLASPPDVVVTYDGRRVSGASLTARLADRSSTILDVRASKAAELIKARPQFAPFKGELPPLNPEIINRNAPQLQARGVLSRDLDTPSVGGAATKLRRLRSVDTIGLERTKRQPHHTPEHTAAQQAEQASNDTQVAPSGSARIQLALNLLVVVVFLKHI